MSRRVFCSTFVYALAKVASHQGLDPYVVTERAMAAKSWPCFVSIHNLSRLLAASKDECELFIESTTTIGKARSRAAYAFVESKADAWVSFDDDAQVEEPVLETLLRCVEGEEPRIVMVPQFTADGVRVNTSFLTTPPEVSRTVDGRRLVPVEFAGCSVMAANRAALLRMREKYPDLACLEQHMLAVFLDEILRTPAPLWLGEDVAFCRRANLAGFEVEALLDVPSMHAGHLLPADWAEPFFITTARTKP